MKMQCSCGSFELRWDVDLSELTARRCSCDYCSQVKAEYLSKPGSVVRWTLLKPEQHRIVRHGFGTAQFHECCQCGLVGVTSEVEGQHYCVINAKVLGLSGYQLDTTLKTFTAESSEQRQLRRQANWSKAECADVVEPDKPD